MLQRDPWVSARTSADHAFEETRRPRASTESRRYSLKAGMERTRADQAVHLVCCPYCRTRFDLFAAAWCEHQGVELSKLCPSCRRCVCEHPAYAEPLFWKDAPTAFQKRGFRRLFMFYL